MAEPLLLKGAPGSPYTRKMLAYMRYRHIPYRLMIGDQGDQEGRALPQPKVSLLPTFYLPNSAGELEAVVDSTPLIRRFESMFTGRETVPSAPALRLLHDLIEDYADEWLTKAMFHYRWHYADDIEKAGLILPLWRDLNQSSSQLEKRVSLSESGRSPGCMWWALTSPLGQPLSPATSGSSQQWTSWWKHSRSCSELDHRLRTLDCMPS